MRHFCKPTGRVLSALAAAWLFACLSGCEKTSPPPAADNARATAKTPAGEKAAAEKKAAESGPRKPAPGQGPLGARAVLEKMVAAYHKASTYQDVGRWQMTKQYAGQKPVDEQRPLSVIMVRPNKLQVKANDAQVVADGKQFRATIDFLPGQVLTKEQPAAVTLPFFDCDAILAQAFARAGGPSHAACPAAGQGPAEMAVQERRLRRAGRARRNLRPRLLSRQDRPARRHAGAVDRSGDLRPAADDSAVGPVAGRVGEAGRAAKPLAGGRVHRARSSTPRWIPSSSPSICPRTPRR